MNTAHCFQLTLANDGFLSLEDKNKKMDRWTDVEDWKRTIEWGSSKKGERQGKSDQQRKHNQCEQFNQNPLIFHRKKCSHKTSNKPWKPSKKIRYLWMIKMSACEIVPFKCVIPKKNWSPSISPRFHAQVCKRTHEMGAQNALLNWLSKIWGYKIRRTHTIPLIIKIFTYSGLWERRKRTRQPTEFSWEILS